MVYKMLELNSSKKANRINASSQYSRSKIILRMISRPIVRSVATVVKTHITTYFDQRLVLGY